MLAHVLTGNTSVQELDASSNSMGAAGAKVFGDMLSMNKMLQTLNVSNNSFGKPQEGDTVKVKSSGEMRVVTNVYSNEDYTRIAVEGSGESLKYAEYELPGISIFATGLGGSALQWVSFKLLAVAMIF